MSVETVAGESRYSSSKYITTMAKRKIGEYGCGSIVPGRRVMDLYPRVSFAALQASFSAG
jgi:hypothetical protein